MGANLLVTLGPSSLNEEVIGELESESIYLYRINLSHTNIDSLESTIKEIQHYTSVPICLDSEGAQIRNQSLAEGETDLIQNEFVTLHYEEVAGDKNNLSFTPHGIAQEFICGDNIQIDFNGAILEVTKVSLSSCLAKVIVGGKIGSNKATIINRQIPLNPITKKDSMAFSIGKRMGIRNFALSFASSKEDVIATKRIIGSKSRLISKVESRNGLKNLSDILDVTDEILIDRGDLSNEVPISKIPFLQRAIVSTARSRNVPVNVATNLLESMIYMNKPNRAEVNDVVSTLMMGATGLVLAAETAIGKYPVETVKMARQLSNEFNKWSKDLDVSEILQT